MVMDIRFTFSLCLGLGGATGCQVLPSTLDIGAWSASPVAKLHVILPEGITEVGTLVVCLCLVPVAAESRSSSCFADWSPSANRQHFITLLRLRLKNVLQADCTPALWRTVDTPVLSLTDPSSSEDMLRHDVLSEF